MIQICVAHVTSRLYNQWAMPLASYMNHVNLDCFKTGDKNKEKKKSKLDTSTITCTVYLSVISVV